MKPNQKSKPKPWLAITLVIFFIVLALVIWKILIPMYFPGTQPNYAQEVAKPLEAGLANAGAVKKCSRGDNGRGSDNDMPNYFTVYELPGNQDKAINSILTVAKDNGFKLVDGQLPPDPQDNRFFTDSVKKVSPYPDLLAGNISLDFEVFGSSSYDPAYQFCGVTKRDKPSSESTTIRMTVNLPAFKR
jgi:hypothetical protein